MSDAEPSKSHATRWIVGVVLAVVLYLGSATPVAILLYRYELSVTTSFGIPRWLSFVDKALSVFYKPASWVWNQPGLVMYDRKWNEYWLNIFYDSLPTTT